MAQKLAPAEKNSTDISVGSATFCISGSRKTTFYVDHPYLGEDGDDDDAHVVEVEATHEHR